MQLATTKQVRAIMRSMFGTIDETWTDKCAQDARLRRLAFKIGNDYDRDLLERTRKQIQDLLTLAGFSNRVTVTDSGKRLTTQQLIFCRNNTGVYVRVKALLA